MNRTIGYVLNGKYIKSGIIDNNIKQGKEHAQHRDHVRKEMARDYARDLVQPHTPEFIDAFPDKAKRMGLVPQGEE